MTQAEEELWGVPGGGVVRAEGEQAGGNFLPSPPLPSASPGSVPSWALRTQTERGARSLQERTGLCFQVHAERGRRRLGVIGGRCTSWDTGLLCRVETSGYGGHWSVATRHLGGAVHTRACSFSLFDSSPLVLVA